MIINNEEVYAVAVVNSENDLLAIIKDGEWIAKKDLECIVFSNKEDLQLIEILDDNDNVIEALSN